jgi:dihydrofolate reductase
MRKIIFMIHVSLDGRVSDEHGGLDWMSYDSELESYAHSMHARTDAAIYGRITYGMMKGYWPTVPNNPGSSESELSHAKWANHATKYVFSRSIDEAEVADWANSVIVRDAAEFEKIKQEAGKDIWLLGSPRAAQELMRCNLIDEYRINVNPSILGKGQLLFEGVEDIKLKLIESKTLKSGVVCLRYEPAKA